MSADFEAATRKYVDNYIKWISCNKESLCAVWLAATGIKPEDSVIINQIDETGRMLCWIERKSNVPLASAYDVLDNVRRLLDESPNSELREAIRKAIS